MRSRAIRTKSSSAGRSNALSWRFNQSKDSDDRTNSPLSNAEGWIEVDPGTLQHVRYPNVFSLGDASSAPTAKTAAAVRLQAPVVVKNILAAKKGEPLPAIYDGYGSCPLTVAYGKIVLAEFVYSGKVPPSFPRSARTPPEHVAPEVQVPPWLYWSHMLRGEPSTLATVSATGFEPCKREPNQKERSIVRLLVPPDWGANWSECRKPPVSGRKQKSKVRNHGEFWSFAIGYALPGQAG
jgi:hypothetical protein